jgi:serine/threonine-protein kinase
VTDSSTPEETSYPETGTRKSFLGGLIGMKIADRYEVVRTLGEGGMGVVAEARHISLGHRVAIKFMFPDLLSNETLSARFSREAKLAAKIQSPHIVRMTDVGRLPNGVPYLVMDLLTGHDLGAELEEKGTLSVEKAVDYTLQACAGVAALHAIGAVHRDLKPSNLFVADMAGVSTVMVLDFGIAKDFDVSQSASITSTETQLGTPMYMSPEQIRSSKNVDARSDIWSLGVILYELLTGTLPFERNGNSLGELFAVILMSDPIPLCMRRPDLPVELEEVVMRCLRRGSWDRHENVGAFAEALRPFLRPNMGHRVDAVRKALGNADPASGEPPPPTRGTEPTVSATPVAKSNPPAGSSKSPPGLAVTPQLELDVDPARSAPPVYRQPPPSPSFVSSSRSVPLPEQASARGSKMVAMVAGAALLLGAGLAFAIYATSSTTATTSEPVLASPAPTPTLPPPVATQPWVPADPIASAAPPPSALRVAQPATKPAPSASPRAQVVPPPPPPAKGPAGTKPHAPASDDDLIDSRK